MQWDKQTNIDITRIICAFRNREMKVFRLSILLIVLLGISSINCKKNKDYRDDYTGNYDFTIIYSVFNYSDSTLWDSTSYYSGHISKNTGPNSITICYLPMDCLGAILSEEGHLFKIPNSGLGYAFGGEFKNKDHVEFTYFSYTTKTVTGIKK